MMLPMLRVGTNACDMNLMDMSMVSFTYWKFTILFELQLLNCDMVLPE